MANIYMNIFLFKRVQIGILIPVYKANSLLNNIIVFGHGL